MSLRLWGSGAGLASASLLTEPAISRFNSLRRAWSRLRIHRTVPAITAAAPALAHATMSVVCSSCSGAGRQPLPPAAEV